MSGHLGYALSAAVVLGSLRVVMRSRFMPVEIERKFLVANDAWRSGVTGVRQIKQAYLMNTDRISVRVRIVAGEGAWLTMKTGQYGLSRHEYQYPIPINDAEDLIEHRQGAIIAKTRHHVPSGSLIWEIDVFEGANSGLLIAEIEIPAIDCAFERPGWLGEEITQSSQYYNSELALNPFSAWKTGPAAAG